MYGKNRKENTHKNQNQQYTDKIQWMYTSKSELDSKQEWIAFKGNSSLNLVALAI